MPLDVFGGLEPWVLGSLGLGSFIGSFMTVALGIGGGALMLAIMASLLPPAALIPVHAVIQLGSNLFRALIMWRHIHWPPVGAFAIGCVLGVSLGGAVAVSLPGPLVLIGVGLFVIWSVLAKPPAWLSQYPFVTGAFSSVLTMFFGATGVFVANFVKSLNMTRQRHVATHATLMMLQHGLKIVAFGVLGFAFGPWLGVVALMIGAGVLGTLAGRLVLEKFTDHGFKRVLDILLVLISIRLIWQGVAGLV